MSDAASKPRVILADEALMLCETLGRVLQPEFEVISQVGDARSLFAAAALAPDIVVADTNLPDVKGAEVVRGVLSVSPLTRVIVLTTGNDDAAASAALQAGAVGYLLKTAPVEELSAAIREVRRGRTYVTPHVAARLAARPEKTPLTAREREVLALIIDGKRMRELAAILNVKPRTVAFHKYRIMKKLNVRSSAELIRTAILGSLTR
jgi:DNA-binding NarL/FixJ family response regulator